MSKPVRIYAGDYSDEVGIAAILFSAAVGAYIGAR